MKRMMSALLLFGAVTGCQRARETAVPPPAAVKESKAPVSHQEEFNQWKEKRRERLTSESGWLTLTGLFWLQDGANEVGSAKDDAIVLPAAAPAEVGVLRKEGAKVFFEPAANSGVTIDDKAVTTKVEMIPDTAEKPTIAKIGTVTFQVIERVGKLGVRVKDSNAESRRNFKGLDYYPFSDKLRVEARLEKYNPPKEIAIVNVLGMVEKMVSPGALVFTIDGAEYRLDPVLEEGESDLFVIFGDKTNGKDTYGAGRYVYAPPPDANGKTFIDFNRAYNPPCVFTTYATCPLPPQQNKLPIRIEAGEKKYAGHE
jgi:uncharacterized protein (DUF1684 family)